MVKGTVFAGGGSDDSVSQAAESGGGGRVVADPCVRQNGALHSITPEYNRRAPLNTKLTP